MAKRVFYRDTKNGHFVSFGTWNRSASNRYVRQEVEIEEEPDEPTDEDLQDENLLDELEEWEEMYDEADEYEVDEYTGAFDTGKKGKGE